MAKASPKIEENTAQPILRQPDPLPPVGSFHNMGQSTLVDLRNGKRTVVSVETAKRWADKHPGQFKIEG